MKEKQKSFLLKSKCLFDTKSIPEEHQRKWLFVFAFRRSGNAVKKLHSKEIPLYLRVIFMASCFECILCENIA